MHVARIMHSVSAKASFFVSPPAVWLYLGSCLGHRRSQYHTWFPINSLKGCNNSFKVYRWLSSIKCKSISNLDVIRKILTELWPFLTSVWANAKVVLAF